MVRPSHIYHLNTHELPRRAGEMKEYQLDLVLPEPVGVPLIAVQEGDVVEVDARLEAVTEGILLSADIYAVATGECIRCLDPVELTVERNIQELYLYEGDGAKKKVHHKKSAPVSDELEEEDLRYLDGVIMDLEPPIRDAIVLNLPVNPLCDPDCLGLCPECGQKWAILPENHRHDVIDARWAGLAGLDFKNSDS
ncbi:MAG: YceD family protein [Candidatus Planktophila sp.]